MTKQTKTSQIVEDVLRNIVSSQGVNGSVLAAAEEVANGQTPSSARPPQFRPAVDTPSEVQAPEQRRRRIPMPEYSTTFLRNTEVKRRSVIYASEEVKLKLAPIVYMLGDGQLTVTAYVENILRNLHEIYGEENTRLLLERNFNNLI